jgi:hypothetical protein
MVMRATILIRHRTEGDMGIVLATATATEVRLAGLIAERDITEATVVAM